MSILDWVSMLPATAAVFFAVTSTLASARRNLEAATQRAGCAAIAYVVLALTDVLSRNWIAAAIAAACALFWAWLWWRGRKDRKKALRTLGAKSKARLEALVRNMPKPGPVLRPVPQSA